MNCGMNNILKNRKVLNGFFTFQIFFARFLKMSEVELKRKVDEILDDNVECSNKKTEVDQEIGT